MSWEQRNNDFSTAQADAQVAYIEAEREVKRLQAENEKLRKLVLDMRAIIWTYDECTSGDDCPPALPLFEDRLRELGVEV